MDDLKALKAQQAGVDGKNQRLADSLAALVKRLKRKYVHEARAKVGLVTETASREKLSSALKIE